MEEFNAEEEMEEFGWHGVFDKLKALQGKARPSEGAQPWSFAGKKIGFPNKLTSLSPSAYLSCLLLLASIQQCWIPYFEVWNCCELNANICKTAGQAVHSLNLLTRRQRSVFSCLHPVHTELLKIPAYCLIMFLSVASSLRLPDEDNFPHKIQICSLSQNSWCQNKATCIIVICDLHSCLAWQLWGLAGSTVDSFNTKMQENMFSSQWLIDERLTPRVRKRRACSLMKPAASFWSYKPPSSSKEAIFSSYKLYGDFLPTTTTLPCKARCSYNVWEGLRVYERFEVQLGDWLRSWALAFFATEIVGFLRSLTLSSMMIEFKVIPTL